MRHRSRRFRVGARRRIGDRGEVTACLTQTGDGPTWLTINAAHMVGVSVDIALLDTAELRDALTGLLLAAGYE
ncbi:hypothetical protein FHR83_006735 [Actinoplanes campanulatus]|uniref:Uncharacterized protein n=1 Tax=Actinoplanes campanulatus TaxID=113559 RepID=A0A7W5ANH5_9ACTN|nr:hypothetical protein [Actinoplanes campanulatus]MBB3099029.1 hypothetical protein [Actinoplanes campanulatus]